MRASGPGSPSRHPVAAPSARAFQPVALAIDTVADSGRSGRGDNERGSPDTEAYNTGD